MDAYEATKIVFQRIQSLDPQNAAKIMGVLLIQDHGEKGMIRLAFGPESLLQSLILKAKKELSLSSSPPSFCNSNSSPLSRQNSCPNPPPRLNLPSPLSISTWNNSDFQNPDDLISPGGGYTCTTAPSPSTMNSAAAPFYGSGGEIDLIDELNLQDQLSFLTDGASSQIGGKSPDFYYPHHQDLALSPTWAGGGGGPNGLPHRRSYSVSDIYLGPDDGGCGLGWKPCLFYARGYCKNGTSCRFLHGGDAAAEELLRTKPTQQLIGSPNSNFAYPPLSAAANKCFHLLDSPRALIMGDGMPKFGRGRNGEFGINPGSRQIYLTFPADSTFKEEDVSNYFSNFGPVQDVRIPYQQKRMFGFVTFEYPETVKMILAKGNPHFVCDARVLVKPYKEKGKISDKHRKQQQQMDRVEFGNSVGIESRGDPYDVHLGARMFYGAPDMLWKRKLEEADLQQTIELQNRRLMGLQLLDVKRNSHQCGLSNGAMISSPTYSPTSFFSLNVMSSNQSSPDAKEENGTNLGNALQPPANVIEKDHDKNKIDKESPPKDSESSDHHNLPDSPFASPEAAGDFSPAFLDSDKSSVVVSNPLTNSLTTSPALFPTSSINMSPFKSCYFQMPRFASGRETVGM